MVKPTTGFEEIVNAYRFRSIAFISGLIDTMVKPTTGFEEVVNAH